MSGPVFAVARLDHKAAPVRALEFKTWEELTRGLTRHRIGPAAWMLRHAHGACIGTVYGHEALAAAVAGFEAARNDVLAIVRSMEGA